jgi:molybdopterin-guanine dinucleotide biosynthesis protein
MKRVKKMLLVGATEKHAGKTTLTVKIIKKIKSSNSRQKLTAIKITILRDGKHSVSGYKITDETKTDSVKDTARMLNAGADRVLWLRCDEFNAEIGVEKLLEDISQDSLIICESNSARNYIEPGLFLMVRKKDEGEIKTTAQKVLSFPHIEVRTEMINGDVSYDPDISEIIETDSGGWHLSL